MEALNDLVKAGKVRALGASAMYGYQFYNMQLVAKEHGCLGSSGGNTTGRAGNKSTAETQICGSSCGDPF